MGYDTFDERYAGQSISGTAIEQRVNIDTLNKVASQLNDILDSCEYVLSSRYSALFGGKEESAKIDRGERPPETMHDLLRRAVNTAQRISSSLDSL